MQTETYDIPSCAKKPRPTPAGDVPTWPCISSDLRAVLHQITRGEIEEALVKLAPYINQKAPNGEDEDDDIVGFDPMRSAFAGRPQVGIPHQVAVSIAAVLIEQYPQCFGDGLAEKTGCELLRYGSGLQFRDITNAPAFPELGKERCATDYTIFCLSVAVTRCLSNESKIKPPLSDVYTCPSIVPCILDQEAAELTDGWAVPLVVGAVLKYLNSPGTQVIQWLELAAVRGCAFAPCLMLDALKTIHHAGEQCTVMAHRATETILEHARSGIKHVGCLMAAASIIASEHAIIAVSYLERAAELGAAPAMYALYEIYAGRVKLDHLVADQAVAQGWLERAAWKGHINALYYAGLRAYKARDYTEALKHWRQADKAGDINSRVRIGVCYGKGRGVEANKSEAIQILRPCVDRGSAMAMMRLGELYDVFGNEHEWRMAIALYQKAALLHYAPAYYCLGRTAYNAARSSAPQTVEYAITWLTRALEAGIEKAAWFLAMLYRFTSKYHDLSKAYMFFERHCKFVAEEGRGDGKPYDKAVFLFESALIYNINARARHAAKAKSARDGAVERMELATQTRDSPAFEQAAATALQATDNVLTAMCSVESRTNTWIVKCAREIVENNGAGDAFTVITSAAHTDDEVDLIKSLIINGVDPSGDIEVGDMDDDDDDDDDGYVETVRKVNQLLMTSSSGFALNTETDTIFLT